MDDEKTPEQLEQEQVEKAQQFIKGEVERHIKELYKPVESKGQLSDEEQQRQRMREFLDPYVSPGVNEAKLAAADAKDELKFYRAHPEALDLESEIEGTFQNLVKANRPMTREDIYRNLLGKQYTEDPQKFMERASAKRQAQVARAEEATDIVTASFNKAKGDKTFSGFEKLSIEDMEKALEGVAF